MNAESCHLDDTSLLHSLHNAHCYYPCYVSCADWPEIVAYGAHLGLRDRNCSFVRHRHMVHLHAAVNYLTCVSGLEPELVLAPVAVAAVNNISCAR